MMWGFDVSGDENRTSIPAIPSHKRAAVSHRGITNSRTSTTMMDRSATMHPDHHTTHPFYPPALDDDHTIAGCTLPELAAVQKFRLWKRCRSRDPDDRDAKRVSSDLYSDITSLTRKSFLSMLSDLNHGNGVSHSVDASIERHLAEYIGSGSDATYSVPLMVLVGNLLQHHRMHVDVFLQHAFICRCSHTFSSARAKVSTSSWSDANVVWEVVQILLADSRDSVDIKAFVMGIMEWAMHPTTTKALDDADDDPSPSTSMLLPFLLQAPETILTEDMRRFVHEGVSHCLATAATSSSHVPPQSLLMSFEAAVLDGILLHSSFF